MPTRPLQDALDTLAVLRALEALNRLAPHLSAWLDGRAGRLRGGASATAGRAAGAAAGAGAGEVAPWGHLPRDAFLSPKLAPKLNQQLKDVLSICGGGWASVPAPAWLLALWEQPAGLACAPLPALAHPTTARAPTQPPTPSAGALPPWCGQLARAARFLFPFESRRRYFYCTSFGLARALHYLQQVGGCVGGCRNGWGGRRLSMTSNTAGWVGCRGCVHRA